MPANPNSADLLLLRKFTDDCPMAMLTNQRADGTLVSRPMAPLEMDGQGAFWFFTDWRHVELEHLGTASLSFTDALRGTCVSISGRSEIHADRARIARLRSRSARLPHEDAQDARNLALLKFVSVTAEVWDTPREHMLRMFDLRQSRQAARFIRFSQPAPSRHPPRQPVTTAFGSLVARAALAFAA